MKINKIHLSNYRNFKDYQISFGTETTIFIGKNGMGKTNLIAGLKQALSFIFSKKKGEPQYLFIASSDQKVESFSATDARYGATGSILSLDPEYEFNYIYPIAIKAEAAILSEEILAWSFYKENVSSGLKDSLYRDANATFWTYYLSRHEKLPIFAYFSDSYPHIKTNIGKNVQEMLDSGNEPPQNIAYYKWDEEKNCTEIWVQYFTMQWKNHKFNANKEKQDYVDAITEKMIEFSKPLSDVSGTADLELKMLELEARGKNDVLIMVFANGDRIPFNQLPQGYKRIFSIVFDIANRSYILNTNCDSSGIVLIDELELHLHPSIAQEILVRLKGAFPHIQFVVTTHSPLIITNFKQDNANVLYKLYKENGEYKNEVVEDIYGVDYNSGLKYSMDTPERDSYVHELQEAYLYWKDEDNTDMMNKLKEKIRETVGENSRFYQSLFD